jgi:hypothetical protein
MRVLRRDLVRRPIGVLLLALALMTAFAGMRVAIAAHGHVGALVLRGSVHTSQDPGQDPDVPVVPGVGYDGQFYYRMALAPADLAKHGHGVVIDDGLRRARIGYPALAYVVALGQARAIPYALLVLNVLAVALTAWLGALLAVTFGRSPLWGLLVAGYGGLVTSVARDLTEPTEIALLTAAVLLLARRRPLWASVAMTAAALTRETALLLPAALVLVAAWRLARSRSGPTKTDLVWLLPFAGWAAWEVVCKYAWGQLPITDEGRNSGTLFAASFHAVARWISAPDRGRVLFLVEVLSLLVVVVLAVVAARRTSPGHLLVGLGLAVFLMLSLSGQVWNDDPTESRTFAEVHLLGSAALLTTPTSRARALAAVATGIVWVLTAALRVYQL